MVLLFAAKTVCNSSNLMVKAFNSFSVADFSSFFEELEAAVRPPASSWLLSLEAELSCLVMLLSGVVALELDLEVILEETAVLSV